jgi:hypothetical protein
MGGHMREKKSSPTIEVCFYKEGPKRLCGLRPTWKIEGSTESLKFKVCDDHLAWAIRLSGFPALVDAHVAPAIKEEETEVFLDVEGVDLLLKKLE